MRARLKLLEKNNKRIVYAYSSDASIDLIDGEIELDLKSENFSVIKKATNDDNGGHGVWLFPHLSRLILREGCPDKKFIATG